MPPWGLESVRCQWASASTSTTVRQSAAPPSRRARSLRESNASLALDPKSRPLSGTLDARLWSRQRLRRQLGRRTSRICLTVSVQFLVCDQHFARSTYTPSALGLDRLCVAVRGCDTITGIFDQPARTARPGSEAASDSRQSLPHSRTSGLPICTRTIGTIQHRTSR